MQYTRRTSEKPIEPDMTPMIDMTFLLIAFFMVLIDFSKNEQEQAVRLPSSDLAKPPEGPLEHPLFLHLQKDGQVIFKGRKVSISGAGPLLLHESNVIRTQGTDIRDCTVVIRADVDGKHGQVQELIKVCQDAKFETFALRAKYEKTGKEG